MFSILKCQSPDCQICEVPRLPPDIFKQIHHLPDPVPSGERYKSFTELYGKVNPSLDCLDDTICTINTLQISFCISGA
jgi:hypothetical protein